MIKLLFLVLTAYACYGQKVVHTSYHIVAVNGSWDLTSNPSRAQFSIGNKNIQALFIKNFKLTAERLHRVRRGFVELEFTVREDSKIDSVKFIKRDEPTNDVEAARLLSLTDGAWRPAVLEGKTVPEKMLIRFFFSDNAEKKSSDKDIEKAKKFFEKRSYNDCLRYCEQVLAINPFDTEMLKLKSLAFSEQGKHEEACEILRLAKKYYASDIDDIMRNNCK